jgi:hypothetical protein
MLLYTPSMKQFLLIVFLSVSSVCAFAQFPLGASKDSINAYFAVNVQYASAQEFKTKNGLEGLCFTKVRVMGDYTFYFNEDEVCTLYTETYDTKQIADIIWCLDRKFCRISPTEWTDEDNSSKITLVRHPKKGANFVSIEYKPIEKTNSASNTLVAN